MTRFATVTVNLFWRLAHRGASGAEVDTGDGSGITVQVPHAFFSKEADRAGVALASGQRPLQIRAQILDRLDSDR